MNQPDAVKEQNQSRPHKKKSLNEYGTIVKGGLFDVRQPRLKTWQGTLAPVDTKARQWRESKPPPAEEHQPDIQKVLSKIAKEVRLDIVPDGPSLGLDEALIVRDKRDKLQEEAQVTQELLVNLSPLNQRQPTSSSRSTESAIRVVEDMLSWISNSRLFHGMLSRPC
jgi:hypothetical protein